MAEIKRYYLAPMIMALLLACSDTASRPDAKRGDSGSDIAASDFAGTDAPPMETSVVDIGNPDSANAATCSALVVTGDPKSNAGAKWTYKATDDGVAYDLQGALFRPAGAGPFAGIILSHGKGGSPGGWLSTLARQMTKWDVVGIVPAYTHALTPTGTPTGPDGASTANLQRAHKARDLLGCLGYVKMDRVAAHGHSMGAFLTTALVGTHPTAYHVASHTAGGMNNYAAPPFPSAAMVNGVKAPYQMHHGDKDSLVQLKNDQALAAELTKNQVANELHVYPGYTHNQVTTDATMLSRVKSWYTKAGLW